MRPLLLAVLLCLGSAVGSAFAADVKALNWIGTGVVVFKIDNNMVIKRVIAGTPAADAGVKVNDRIIKIDDTNVEGLPVAHVLDLLRGAPDTMVKLVVVRPGAPAALTFTVARKPIHVDEIMPPPSTD
jgi:carboxyl-terminal processing protease